MISVVSIVYGDSYSSWEGTKPIFSGEMNFLVCELYLCKDVFLKALSMANIVNDKKGKLMILHLR